MIVTTLARLRVRVKTLAAALVVAIPAMLQAVGAIDFTPLLELMVGEKRAAGYAVLISLAFAFLKPVFVLEKKDD